MQLLKAEGAGANMRVYMRVYSVYIHHIPRVITVASANLEHIVIAYTSGHLTYLEIDQVSFDKLVVVATRLNLIRIFILYFLKSEFGRQLF